ncbi:hypothetical protein ACIBH1_26125 [Nonomuraea sp. NPDC050663]|uniref:hypothetical protein n=1 Tax=Nonomuraea sp. NPDC050663 TaxID=3364370 RepID=UPI0037B50B1E
MKLGTHDPQQVAAVRAVLESLGGTEVFGVAVLSGSRAAGLGHAYSDTDVHVVLREGASLPRRTFVHDGVEVQLTPVSRAVLLEYVSLSEAYVATAASRAQSTLTFEQLWNFVRLASGTVLLADAECSDLLARCDGEVARQVVMANFMHKVARNAEDAAGMLAFDDPYGASHAALLALKAALEVALAGTGDIYAMDRFLLRRLGRAGLLTPELWGLLNQQTPDVGARLHAAAALNGWSLVHGWDKPLESLPPLGVGHTGRPLRDPAFGLQRFADRWALSGPGKSMRVTELVAAVWIRLDGRAPEAIAAELRAAGYGDIQADQVTSCVEGLVRSGVATPPASSTET